MKKHITKILALATALFALSAGFLVNHNLKKHYRPGDYVPEEDAYFVEEIDDPAGLVKAHKFVTPTDNKYNSQKTRSLGSSLIGDIESVWGSYTGKGTTVAIIDDGFDYDHPEYTRSDGSHAILSTSRYYYASGNSAYYKSYSSDPTCIAEDWDSDENEWATHGTNTSTTAAAPMNNGGGVGIAPEADILALKIDFSFVAIKAAIQYAINQKVDVINMSLGAYAESFTDGWGDSQSGSSSTATYLNSVCQSAYNAGIIVVAAAGNESTWHKSYPACNTKVIGVGALGDYDNKGNANKLAEFTNYVSTSQSGEINVDILAPGYVYTATQGGTMSSVSHTYSDTQGTSFSCPIIAGAACLWKQKNPNGTPDQFLTKLQETADGIGTYASKMIEVSGWYSSLSDVGPSNIQNGRLNVAKLMDISDPFISTKQSSVSIAVGESKQIELDTYNGDISYTSSNTNIATVNNSGRITGAGVGSTTITVTATKNNKTATATVSVIVASAVAATTLAFNPASISIEAGETYNAKEIIQVTPSNASKIFLFESEDQSVATVDEDTGLITAVDVGTTNINVIAIYGDGYDSLSVTVTPQSTPASFTKVTSSSAVTTGEYLIVYETASKAFDGSLTSLDSTPNTINVSISNESIAYNSTTAASKFTISSETNGFSIKSASGYYIGRSNNSNGIDTSASYSASYLNTITIDNSGNATITASGGKKLLFNDSSGQNKFRYLGTAKNIQLYKASSSGSSATVTGVTVTPSSLTLDLYSGPTEGTLSASVSGTGSFSQGVNWTSSDDSIASVSTTGAVTAHAKGTVTITATSKSDSTVSGTASVTVNDSTPKTLSEISIANYRTSFSLDETFVFGGTVTAHYLDGTTADVTTSATFSGYDTSTPGTQTVTVTYTESITVTTTYEITVKTSGSSGGTSIVTINFASGGNCSDTSGSFTGVSFTSAKESASSSPAYNASSYELRLYYGSGNGNSITLTPDIDYTITQVKINASGQSYTPSVNYRVDDGGSTAGSWSSLSMTISGIEAESQFKFWNANSTNTQLRIKSIEVTLSTVQKEVTGISVATAPTKISYRTGEYFNPSGLVITRSYDNSTSDTYTYADHESEFTFDPSTSTALALSDTEVTIWYGGFSTTQSITVNPSLASISVSGQKTTYWVGEAFSFNGTCTAHYDNSTSAVVTPTSVTSPDMSTSGNKTITVSYTEAGVTKTVDYTITVNALVLSSISITTQPTKTTYYVGESFTSAGLVVTAIYTNESFHTVTPTSISSPDMFSAGSKTVTVSYTEGGVTKTDTFTITVTAVVLESISLSNQTTYFHVGDTFSFGGTVTAHYNNGTSNNVTNSATFTGYNLSTAGEQTVTVSYGGKSTTYIITVLEQGQGNPVIHIDTEGETTYTKYTGSITEGDYVLVYNGVALNNTTSSAKRLQYDDVTVSGNVITSEVDDSCIWHIAPSGDYWTLENLENNEYAGSTSKKNEATTKTTIDNNTKWTVTGTSTYDFENLARSSGSDPNNKWLRRNGTYGFACYTSSTGGALTLYKREVTAGGSQDVTVTSLTVTSSVTTYHPGENFDKTKLTVKGNYDGGSATLDLNECIVTPSTYMFTYDDARNGTKTINVSWEGVDGALTLNVTRVAYEAPSSSIDGTITGAKFQAAGVTGTSSSAMEDYEDLVVDGVTFSSINTYVYGNYISFGQGEGEFHNTTPFAHPISSMSITDKQNNSRTDWVFYVSTDGETWVEKNSVSLSENAYYYLKVYFSGTNTSGGNGYSNFNLNFSLRNNDTPINVANYIMYEDTTNQCTTKFDTAYGYFKNLTSEGRATFMTSNDYVISTARERFLAWAKHEGKTISYINGDYVAVNSGNNVLSLLGINKDNSTLLTIVLLSFLGVTAIGGYFFVRKRKENQ